MTILKNRDLVAGSLILSRSGKMFMVLEARSLSRRLMGVRYMWVDPDGSANMDYTEEDRNNAFLMDCEIVSSPDHEVIAEKIRKKCLKETEDE